MNKAQLFFYSSLSFIVGILTTSLYYPRIVDTFWLGMLLLGGVMIGLVFYANKKLISMIVFGGCFLMGAWITTTQLSLVLVVTDDSHNFSGEVLVKKEPTRKDRTQKIIVKNIFDKEKIKEQEAIFLVVTGIYPDYHYGEKLKIKCVLERPQNKDDDFDYQMYLAKDSIFYLCKNPVIERIAINEGNQGYATVLRIKKRIEEKVMRLLPAPESGLLLGLLLGGNDWLSQTVQDNFSRTGLTHIVAVSGYNVTIVAEYLMLLGIFLGLWRQQAFWLASVGIFLFVVMVGFPASAVRAGVMGGLLLWAMKNGRLANAQNAIIFAASTMLVANPLLLRWDVGFQLSFLATLGIVYFYPVIERYSIRKQDISFFSELLFLTLSAQIFVLPIILNNFQKLPVISLIANLLVLPIIPLTMLLGFLMIVFAFIFPPVAMIFSWLNYIPLHYEMVVVEWLANWKFSSIEISNFSWAWVFIWYIIVIGILMKAKKLFKSSQSDENDARKIPF